jgi:hypothetical protein
MNKLSSNLLLLLLLFLLIIALTVSMNVIVSKKRKIDNLLVHYQNVINSIKLTTNSSIIEIEVPINKSEFSKMPCHNQPVKIIELDP